MWEWNVEGDGITHIWAGTPPSYPRVVYYHHDMVTQERGAWTVIDSEEGHFLPTTWEMPICM